MPASLGELSRRLENSLQLPCAHKLNHGRNNGGNKSLLIDRCRRKCAYLRTSAAIAAIAGSSTLCVFVGRVMARLFRVTFHLHLYGNIVLIQAARHGRMRHPISKNAGTQKHNNQFSKNIHALILPFISITHNQINNSISGKNTLNHPIRKPALQVGGDGVGQRIVCFCYMFECF